jgi:hypothetical protein
MKSLQRRRGLLFSMLTYSRPAGESMDRAFRERFLLTLPGAFEDTHGNIHVAVGDSRVLFSCHTDTATSYDGRQTIHYDATSRFVGLSKRSKRIPGVVLGADDTAGCFIMIEMILASVQGYYVFHYGEEIGGQGSRALAETEASWLDADIDIALAFDRRGTANVITHQGMSRCCSDTFARALSAALNTQNERFAFRPCPNGIYTDTAEYVDSVAECSNLSVGYYREHSSGETLDVDFLLSLSDALQRIDFTALPIDRDPVWEAKERMRYLLERSKQWQQNQQTVPGTNYGRTPEQWVDASDDIEDTPINDATDVYDTDETSGRCDYLDPEWERIQRALERLEWAEQNERKRIEAAKRRQPQVIVGRF